MPLKKGQGPNTMRSIRARRKSFIGRAGASRTPAPRKSPPRLTLPAIPPNNFFSRTHMAPHKKSHFSEGHGLFSGTCTAGYVQAGASIGGPLPLLCIIHSGGCQHTCQHNAPYIHNAFFRSKNEVTQ